MRIGRDGPRSSRTSPGPSERPASRLHDVDRLPLLGVLVRPATGAFARSGTRRAARARGSGAGRAAARGPEPSSYAAIVSLWPFALKDATRPVFSTDFM